MTRRTFIVSAAASAAALSCHMPKGIPNYGLGLVSGAQVFMFTKADNAGAATALINVPNSFAFEPLVYNYNFNTSAVAANRNPRIELIYNNIVIGEITSSSNMTASLAWRICSGPSLGFPLIANQVITMVSPRVIVPPGGQISLTHFNGQAGDNITDIAILGLAWPIE